MATITEMVDQIKAQTAQLDRDGQAALVDALEEWLDELRWDLSFSSPEGQATLDRLTAEAMADVARGDVEDGGFDGR
ncbi:MAG TPA: hypothetical protein VH599_10250 [Ktedonobacterales bacterium]|jgi:hypothetical protein